MSRQPKLSASLAAWPLCRLAGWPVTDRSAPPGEAGDEADVDGRIAAATAELADAAEAEHMRVIGGRVGPADAAALLGISKATMKNWRACGSGPRFVRLGVGDGGKVSYRLEDLAAFLVERAAERH